MRRVVAAVIARLRTDTKVGVVFDTGPGRYGQQDAPKAADGRAGKHTIVRPAYDTIGYERIADGRTVQAALIQVVHVGWHPEEVGAIRARTAALLDGWAPLSGATGLREQQTVFGEEADVTPRVPYSISEYRTEIPGGTP